MWAQHPTSFRCSFMQNLSYKISIFFLYILHGKYTETWKSFSMFIEMAYVLSLGCTIMTRTTVVFFLVKNGGFSWKSVLRYLCSSRKTILARLILTGPSLGRVLSIWSTNRLWTPSLPNFATGSTIPELGSSSEIHFLRKFHINVVNT